MKNTILKFEERTGTINGRTYYVPDYFSKKTNLNELLNSFNSSEFLFSKQIQENDRLERIQFDLYGNQDYWDIIAIINNISTILDMPIGEDIVKDEAQRLQEELFNGLYREENVNRPELEDEILESVQNLQDKKRILKLVPPERIQEFISILKENNFIS